MVGGRVPNLEIKGSHGGNDTKELFYSFFMRTEYFILVLFLCWFVIVLNKCRDSICQPKLREKYLPALIPTLTGIIVGYLMCPPQVAGILSAIVAVYIQDQGLDKFCQNYPDS